MKPSKNRRDLVFNRFGGRCGYTGLFLPKDGWTIEHIIPRKSHLWNELEIGRNSPENLIPTFKQINGYKGSLSLEEFRNRLIDLHKRVMYTTNNSKWLKHIEILELQVAFLFGISVLHPFKGQFYFEKHEQKKQNTNNVP